MGIINGMFNRECFDFRIMLIIKTIITAQTTSLQKLTAEGNKKGESLKYKDN